MAEKEKYAALMLFQFRTEKDGLSNKKRLCEERIILFEGTSAAECYGLAVSRGRDEEFSYTDGDVEVFFEFVGIKEFIELNSTSEPDEVWYRFVEKLNPMENMGKLIPSKDNLSAFQEKVTRKPGRIGVPGRR
jgi:hypothetical protein